MKILVFVVVATIFEAVGDAVMRIALRTSFAFPARVALFGLAAVLLAMYGLFLNLAPVEFATVTGIYLASLFIMFQVVNNFSFGACHHRASWSAELSLLLAPRLSISGNSAGELGGH